MIAILAAVFGKVRAYLPLAAGILVVILLAFIGWQRLTIKDQQADITILNADLAIEKSRFANYEKRTAQLLLNLQAEREAADQAAADRQTLERIIHENKADDRPAGDLAKRFYRQLHRQTGVR